MKQVDHRIYTHIFAPIRRFGLFFLRFILKFNRNGKSSNDAESNNEREIVLDPVNYAPNKLSYDPIKDACWKKGQP